MKKLSAFLAALLFLTAMTAMGQPLAGKKFEAGTSLAFFSLKGDSSDGSTSYLCVPIRFGWFAWRGLEIEPEVQLTVPLDSGGEMTYFLLANVTYNFKTSGKLVPFVGVGAGLGSGIPLYYVVQPPDDGSSAVGVLGGVKYIVGGIGLLRLEYRLTRLRFGDGDRATINQVLAGLSILF